MTDPYERAEFERAIDSLADGEVESEYRPAEECMSVQVDAGSYELNLECVS